MPQLIPQLPEWKSGDRVRDQHDGTHLGTVIGAEAEHRNHVMVRWDDEGWADPNPSEEYAGDLSPESDPWRATKQEA